MLIDDILNSQHNIIILNYAKDMFAFNNYILDIVHTKYTNSSIYNINIEQLKAQDLINQLANTSLFNDTNYIEILCNNKPLVKQQKELTQLVSSVSNNDQLLLIFHGLNKKELQEKWCSNIANLGIVFSIETKHLTHLVQHILKQNQISIEIQAINLLIELNQLNYTQLFQEVKRLSYLYPAGSLISCEMLQDILINNSNSTIYQLSNAYLAGNLATSLEILAKLYKSIEDIIFINWIMLEDVRKLLKIKDKLKQKHQLSNILNELNIWGEAKSLLPKANQRLSYLKLLEILNQLSEVDLSIKGLTNKDTYSLYTKIVMNLCSADNK